MVCPQCGASNPNTERYCEQCGNPLIEAMARAARRWVVILGICGLLSGGAGYAESLAQADEVIQQFLATQSTVMEGAESRGSAVADVSGDGKPELVLVWTKLGPTYWSNTLSVLSPTGQLIASLPLEGTAELENVREQVIEVRQAVYAKGDPTCCPSVRKTLRYRLDGNRLLMEGAQGRSP